MLAAGGARHPAAAAGAAEAPVPVGETASGGQTVTRHAVAIGGAQLAYTAAAGTLPVRLDKSETQAAMFYVAYHEDGASAATRPITFVFNGGPGSAAAWLHVGALGPRRLSLGDEGTIPQPPARVVDNGETWLDFTDLVPSVAASAAAVTPDDPRSYPGGRRPARLL